MHFAYFYTTTCRVCHEKQPVARQIASDMDIELREWNLERVEGGAEGKRLRISTVPTLALVHGSRVPFRIVGERITPEAVRFLYTRVAGSLTDARADAQ